MPESESIRVLYMEDNAGLARLLQRRLERAGYVVDIAHNGAEGLEMYEQEVYDILAIDQNMPVYDGLEVIRFLSADGPLPPLIMVTGTGSEEIAVEAMKLGAGDYIVKDVDGGYLELLPTVIEQVLQQRALAEEKRQAVEEVKQRNRDLMLLNRLGQSLTATLDLRQVVDQLLHSVTEIINAEGASVWLWDREREGWLICRGVLHKGLEYPLLDLRLSPGEGIAGWVAEKGESVIVRDPPRDMRFAPNVDARTGFHTRSLLAVPLRVRSSVIGVLEVVNKQRGNFEESDCSLVETLASSAGIAIENARLIEKLRQQTEELQARNEELDAFAHTVAHDLKTPLSVMVGYMDVLLEEGACSEEEQRTMIKAVARSGRKLNNIIDELLVLSEVRKRDVRSQPLEMDRIVSEARHRLAHMIDELKPQFIISEELPVARGYAPWIEEVWVNYISNALKYGGRPPRLEIGGSVEEGMVRYWVRDNGPGLSPEEQEALFRPFTQLDGVRAEGHGLGLSIVRRIVERLDGEVGVESENGSGSTFWFRLPI